MPTFADRGATVNRLRIRSRMDPLTARVRASWLLDESALQPPTLPPSAIICIRRLTDPRPGTIALDHARLPPREWSDAVAAAITELARGAGRPGRGEATADVEAVIFADRAEMFACLAADWCAGQLPARWWWRALLDDAVDARAVLRAWLAMPAYIAASIDELASRGAATTFVERLSGADTRALLTAVVVQHGLTWLTPALEPLNQPNRVRSDVAADERAREAGVRPDRGAPTLEGIRRAPWSRWAPESRPQGLRADQQCLLGIALTTRRAPTVVRSASFAAEVHRWCLDVGRAETTSDMADSTPATRHDNYRLDRAAPVTRVQDDKASTLDDTNDRDQTDATIGQAGHVSAQTTDGIESSHRAAAVEQVTSPDIHAPERDMSGDRGGLRRPDAPPLPPVERDTLTARLHEQSAGWPVAQSVGTSTTADALEMPAGPVESSHVLRAYPVSIDTDVGGVFYLLNVALSLGLYGDFTTPLQPGIELSIWDFLTLTGRRLTPPRYRSDALWGHVAEFAGGKGTKGGMGGKDWMRRLLPRVRARLALALPGLDRRRIGTLVCVHRARVVTSPTHLDVMFSLAELPIEVRLSGLDRDPGWVPAADRVIAFHYD